MRSRSSQNQATFHIQLHVQATPLGLPKAVFSCCHLTDICQVDARNWQGMKNTPSPLRFFRQSTACQPVSYCHDGARLIWGSFIITHEILSVCRETLLGIKVLFLFLNVSWMSERIHCFRGSRIIGNMSKEYSKKWAESLLGHAKGSLVYSFMSQLSEDT